jgi:hypothetical protein
MVENSSIKIPVKRALPAPDYVAALQAQTPPRPPGQCAIPGVWLPFDVTCLTWYDIEERGKHYKVAAIPASAELQFLEGESTRGETQVNCWSTGKGSANTLQDKTATCKYGKLIGNSRKAKRNQEIAKSGDGKRRSKVLWDESVKKECYHEGVPIQT